MNIYFYEEFPTSANLEKIKLINFPTKLIIGCRSLKEFCILRAKFNKEKNIRELIYWPILEKDEGYWFSTLSKHSAIKRIIDELKSNNNPLTIMWDAEIPIKKALIFTQLINYFRNRKLIRDFFINAQRYRIKILTSEYPYIDKFVINLLMRIFLIKFEPRLYNSRRISMLYTSFLKQRLKNESDISNFLDKQIKYEKNIFGEIILGLGTISTGVKGDEMILTPKELKRDLRIARNNKVDEVVIFRLGGLNKEYLKVMESYANSL